MTTYEWITTFLVPVTGIVSWIAGSRMRRNSTITAMQATIDLLSERNKELYAEIAELRKQNDNLRDEGIKRDNKINELELQISKLTK